MNTQYNYERTIYGSTPAPGATWPRRAPLPISKPRKAASPCSPARRHCSSGAKRATSDATCRGRPIFYGIGNFIIQNDTVLLEPTENYENVGLGWDATPADFYDARAGYEGPGVGRPTKGQSVEPHVWQNGMHRVRFEAGKLKEIRIYPVDSGYGKPRWQAGRPMLAEGDMARDILERYQRLSKPFGTDVKIDGNVGLIRF